MQFNLLAHLSAPRLRRARLGGESAPSQRRLGASPPFCPPAWDAVSLKYYRMLRSIVLHTRRDRPRAVVSPARGEKKHSAVKQQKGMRARLIMRAWALAKKSIDNTLVVCDCAQGGVSAKNSPRGLFLGAPSLQKANPCDCGITSAIRCKGACAAPRTAAMHFQAFIQPRILRRWCK
jgi:hypothetical protein